MPEDDEEISRTFVHTKTARECLCEYSEAGGPSYGHRHHQNSLSYILNSMTVQELMRVVKCVVYRAERAEECE